jgi:hypothetical protein
MRVRSFTIVAIRLFGLISIVYGLMTFIFILFTMFMLSDMMRSSGMSGMGSALSMQFILPVLMIVLGVVLMVVSRSLGDTLSRGLED